MKRSLPALLTFAAICVMAGCGVAGHYVQSTDSMVPTLKVGDHLGTFGVHNNDVNPIKRFDIVVYKPQPVKVGRDDFAGQVFVHRVIGMPGDRFEFKKGLVLVNGNPLAEPFQKLETIGNEKSFDIPEFTVPDGEYVLLGDNRDQSLDSRFWKKPSIARNDIVGLVTTIVTKEDYDNGKRW